MGKVQWGNKVTEVSGTKLIRVWNQGRRVWPLVNSQSLPSDILSFKFTEQRDQKCNEISIAIKGYSMSFRTDSEVKGGRKENTEKPLWHGGTMFCAVYDFRKLSFMLKHLYPSYYSLYFLFLTACFIL